MTQKSKVVVFDLDDTLYKEVDFLKSAFREIASLMERQFGASGVYEKLFGYWQNGENAFLNVMKDYNIPLNIEDLLQLYHNHYPAISLSDEVKSTLTVLSQDSFLGIITDGRSLSQRHKAEALGLTKYMDAENILISEETGYSKPMSQPYLWFMEKYANCDYWYIGDNPDKDFCAPNLLGWSTVCLLDNGSNIHKQVFDSEEKAPHYKVNRFSDILEVI